MTMNKLNMYFFILLMMMLFLLISMNMIVFIT